jgi:hypothetical protein
MNDTVTPRQPTRFFRGKWTGDGEIIPHPLLRWIARRERVRMSSEAVWLSETIWLVKDHFEFSSGRVLDRAMFCQLETSDRIHVTADDMPGGADIELSDQGFRFTPYIVLVDYHGFTVRLRCLDENVLDEHGCVHGVIKMYFCGVRVATMRLGPINRNVQEPVPKVERSRQ